MKTHEEWLVLVQQRWDAKEGRWRNARMWYPGRKDVNDRYCESEEEAKAVLANAFRKWNGTKRYDENGKRVQRVDEWTSVVSDRETDAGMEIVKHKIKKRIVTDWETVET